MDVTKAPMNAMNNRQEIEQSIACGCFNCLKIFAASEITLWTDKDNTALCPHCERDMVLPNVTEEFLIKVHNHWIPEVKND